MQVSNVRSPIKFTAIVLGFLLAAGCASSKGGSSGLKDWPAQNPFDGAEAITFASVKSTHPSQFRIFFSGNVNGETEPCGCAMNPKGGLDRRINYIRQATTDSPYPYAILEAGNMMFPGEKLDKSQATLQKQRALLLMQGNRLMKVVAQNVGFLDLTAGVAFLKDAAAKEKIPLLSANWVDAKGQLLFAPTMTFDLGREKALIVGLSRGFKGGRDEEGDEPRVLDPVTTLEKIVAAAPADQLIILLSDLGSDMDREIAGKAKRPLIIIGSRDLSSLEIPYHEGSSIVLQGQLQGQQWGSIDVSWKAQAKAWYNVDLGVKFRDFWVRRGQEWAANQSRSDSDERRAEAHLLGEAQTDMLRFTPENLTEKAVYDYRLVDMSPEFGKANEVTPLMTKVRKPR